MSSLSNHLAIKTWLAGAGLALVLLNAAPAPAASLYSCPGTGGGQYNLCGFYVANYPGISLETVTPQLYVFSPGTYNLALTVRSNTYDGLLLGSNATTVVLTTAPTPVPFLFPTVRITPGSRLCFALKILFGPGTYVYFANGTCSDVVVTDDTSPPLSTFRRYGLGVTINGAQSLQVTNGWSIQAAINAASPGNTVTVGPGTYNEDIFLKSGVNVIGAGYSMTILRGTGTTNVVMASGVTNARLAGFKITNSGDNPGNAGFYANGGSVLVDGNWIIGNHNGVYINNGSSSIIRNNIIEQNGTLVLPTKYGIFCLDSPALIANNLVVSNGWYGIFLEFPRSTSAQVINNTIVGNPAAGLWCHESINPVIKNNIIVGNDGGIEVYSLSLPVIAYNDVWGNSDYNYNNASPGLGGISTDPLFDSASLVRYYLTNGSPCLHAGDPDPAYNNSDGTRNTMGAYGGPSAMSAVAASGVTSGFMFVNVGVVPTALITNAGTLAGLANVPADVGAALGIPAWKDAPFGGGPYLNGLFGSSDTAVQYYQIQAAPWHGTTRPALADFQPVLDPLNKYKYVILTNGSVQMTLVNVGPDANGLYLRTDRPDSGYWSSPDLKLILNTYHLTNGHWDFICVAYTNDTLASKLDLPTNQLSRLTLWIDNNPVSVSIDAVQDRYTNTVLECGIIRLATTDENLQFQINVSHPTGFLDSYSLGSYYGRNRFGGYVTSDQYVGAHDGAGTRPTWSGPGTVTISSQPAQLLGQLQPWQTCAYQFSLGALARTINGFDRIYGAWYSDHYYITVSSLLPACVADLNGDGRVDGLDLAIFAQRYGTTNCAPPGIAAPATKK